MVPPATEKLLIRPVSVPAARDEPHRRVRSEATRPALARGFWTLADQSVVSLSNFITTIIIARACVPGELGLYDLGFTVVVLLNGVPKALIWSPYTAYQPHLSSDERARYTASSTLQVLALCAVAAAGLLVASGIAQWLDSPQFALLFLAMSPATALMMLREHVRRLCLAWLRVVEVFVFDCIVVLAQVAGLIWLAQLGKLTAASAYLALGVAGAIAVVWMWLRGARFKFELGVTTGYWSQNWVFGRWLFGGAVAVLGAHAYYRWGLLHLRDIGEVEILASARYLVMAANPVLLGLANYFAPASAATLAEHGVAALYRDVRRGQWVLAAFVTAFFAVIVMFGEMIVVAVYGSEFGGHHHVAIATALGLLSEAMLIPVELGHLSLGHGRFLCVTAVMRLTVSLTLGSLLMVMLGAAGVGYGLFVGNVIALVWQWIVLRRIVGHD